MDVEHRHPCNALVTRCDIDCTCGALTPEQCAQLSTRDATCGHGRAAGTPCPHCLGVNSIAGCAGCGAMLSEPFAASGGTLCVLCVAKELRS